MSMLVWVNNPRMTKILDDKETKNKKKQANHNHSKQKKTLSSNLTFTTTVIGSYQNVLYRYSASYNLELKVVDKLTKINKIDFSMECLTVDFLRDFTKHLKIWFFDSGLGTCHHIQAFQGFSYNFLFS